MERLSSQDLHEFSLIAQPSALLYLCQLNQNLLVKLGKFDLEFLIVALAGNLTLSAGHRLCLRSLLNNIISASRNCTWLASFVALWYYNQTHTH